MKKEELIKKWENELLQMEDTMKKFPPEKYTHVIAMWQKQQLIKCINDLKQLNGEVRQAPHGESSLPGDS